MIFVSNFLKFFESEEIEGRRRRESEREREREFSIFQKLVRVAIVCD